MTTALLVLALLVLLSYTVGTVAGFGSNVLALTVASHLFPLPVLLPALMPLNLVLNAWLVARHGAHVDRALLGRRILPFMVLGLPLGLAVLTLGTPDMLRSLLGGFVLTVGAVELTRLVREGRSAKVAVPLPRWPARVLLIAAGVLQGLFASGGPLVVYFATREIADKSRFRATLAALWLLVNSMIFIGYIVAGLVTRETLLMTGPLVAPLLVGIAVGEWAHARLDQHTFRVLVFALLVVGGVALLV